MEYENIRIDTTDISKIAHFYLRSHTAALKSKTSPEKGWSGEDVRTDR